MTKQLRDATTAARCVQGHQRIYCFERLACRLLDRRESEWIGGIYRVEIQISQGHVADIQRIRQPLAFRRCELSMTHQGQSPESNGNGDPAHRFECSR